jgi:hypothetical protein
VNIKKGVSATSQLYWAAVFATPAIVLDNDLSHRGEPPAELLQLRDHTPYR